MAEDNWFTREFKISHFKFEYDAPEEFVVSQWQDEKFSRTYLIYRLVFGCFFFCLTAASTRAEPGPIEMWLIYVTYWGIILNCMQAVTGAVMVTKRYAEMKKLESAPSYEKMPKLFKFYWAIYNGSVVMALEIAIFYWSLLHVEEFNTCMTYMTHGVNVILVLLDLFIVAHPIRLLHAYIPFSITFAYFLFNLIYYLAGGLDPFGHDWTYVATNWHYPGVTLSVFFGGFLLSFFLQLFVFLLYRLRILIYERKKSNTILSSPTLVNYSPKQVE